MNVAFFRNICSCSQSDFANLLGISKQAYSRKETGKVQYKDSEKQIILKKIIQFVPNVTIDDIFFNSELRKVLYLEKEEVK